MKKERKLGNDYALFRVFPQNVMARAKSNSHQAH